MQVTVFGRKKKSHYRSCILFYHHLILEFAARTCLALVIDYLLESWVMELSGKDSQQHVFICLLLYS